MDSVHKMDDPNLSPVKPKSNQTQTRKDLIKNCLSAGPKQFKEIMTFLEMNDKGLKSRTSLFKQLDKMIHEDLITKSVPKDKRYPVYAIVKNSILDVEMNSHFFREEVNGELFKHIIEILQEFYTSANKKKLTPDSKFVKALLEYFGFYVLFALMEGVQAPMKLSKFEKLTEDQYTKKLQVWLKTSLSLEESIWSPSIVFKNLVNELTQVGDDWKEKDLSNEKKETSKIIDVLQRLRTSLEEIYPKTLEIALRGEANSYEHSKKIFEITNTNFTEE